MITYNTIGRWGRLGNHLFHYASTLGIARHNNYNVEFNFDHPSCRIHKIFNLTKKSVPTDLLPTKILRETHFDFSPSILNCSDNVAVSGNLQCTKYFKHCTNEIKSEFTFKSEIVDSVVTKIPDSFVAVHVRRTDYLTDHRYINLDINWYKNAMKLFSNCNFVIFSDDIKWCKDNIRGPSIYYSKCKNDIEDMCAISMANNIIIANSTFSWWSAFLSNRASKIVCPAKWFNIPVLTEKHLILDSWTRL